MRSNQADDEPAANRSTQPVGSRRKASELDATAAAATTALAAHIATAEARLLDVDVLDRTKKHLLDGLVAMLSGATLRPGQLAVSYARSRGGTGEATVVGGPRTNPELAAFSNAISAHADETDDVNNRARIHPGATIVPAAIAMAEAHDRPGSALLTAVSLGYDVASALNIGAWQSFLSMQQSARTSHGLGQTFGAAAAAASLARLTVDQNRHVLSYAAQQVAGIATFYRDPEHVGKAFTTAAMQAHSGVRAVELVSCGFTGVDDVFDDRPNVFDAFGEGGDVARMLADLRTTHHVMTTDIKRYPVGGPIQAPVAALSELIDEHHLDAGAIESIEVRLPTQGAYIVDSRDMPDINLQYILSVLLIDGRITFASSHDYQRCQTAGSTRELMGRIKAVADPILDVPSDADVSKRRTWCAIVTVTTHAGNTLTRRVDTPRGTHENPLSWDQLISKTAAVLDQVLPPERIDALVAWVRGIEFVESTRELRPIMDAVTSAHTHAALETPSTT